MEITLNSIAKLFGLEIITSGDIRYLQINYIHVITENPFTKELELNSLETYESQHIKIEQLTQLIELTFIHRIKSETSTNQSDDFIYN